MAEKERGRDSLGLVRGAMPMRMLTAKGLPPGGHAISD